MYAEFCCRDNYLMNRVRHSNWHSRIWAAIFNISAEPDERSREHSLAERIAVLTYGFFSIANPAAKQLQSLRVL